MNAHFFVLGIASALAEAEIVHVLKRNHIAFTSVFNESSILALNISSAFNANSLMEELGGTIKIAEGVGQIKNLAANELVPFLDSADPSLTFGISLYGENSAGITSLSSELKKLLKPKFKTVRFVLPQDGVLSSVVVQKQKIVELIIVKNKDHFEVGRTICVQNVDYWSKKDYGRPFADPKSGMLPPKVARMMVNLGLTGSHQTVYDPFCGMGTIVSEALLLGASVVASDLKSEVVKKAEANCEWLRKEFKVPQLLTSGFFVSDASRSVTQLNKHSIDIIITEPFMGSPFELKRGQIFYKSKSATIDAVHDLLKGLAKLYIGALKSLGDILKPQGRVVIILPTIHFENRDYTVKNLIDNCENLGYTLTEGPYTYSRPQAVVKRTIYLFTKH